MNYNDKLSVTEKVGYSLGDLAANLIFQTLATFLAFFYTDVYQIPTQYAATIIFTGGMLGALFNPIMGLIADRTQTRWGKFRPWILWTAVPFGLIALLAFRTPELSENGKVLYAFVTYSLLVIIYSANNLPYSALSGVLTGNMSERNSLSSYRFVAVMIAQFIIQALLLPLVLIFGDGDKALGFQKVMTFFALTGIVFFLISFITTRERVVTKSENQLSVKQDVLDLMHNKPWFIMLLVTILLFITLSLKGGMYIYYFKNYLDEQAIGHLLNNVGFNQFIQGLDQSLQAMGLTGFQWPKDPATSGFSLFNAISILCMIIGITCSKKLADKFGKRDVFGAALFVATVFVFVFVFFAPHQVGFAFVSNAFHGFFYGITIPLLWAMIADVADYSEWKNHRRATAIIFSAMIFGLKMGLSVGGALVAGLLGWYQYDASLTEQASVTAEGIKWSVSIFASIPFFIAIALLVFYQISKSTESLIERELVLRRSKV